MTSDSHSGDPFRRSAGPDDEPSTFPATPAASAPGPAPMTPAAEPSAWAGPAASSGAGSDPFEVPADRPASPAPVPVQVPPVRARGGGGMLVNVILGIALVVAVGGVAFAVGRVTAPVTTAANRTGGNGGGFFQGGGPNASGAPGGINGGFGGGGVSIQGTVTAVSADSISLQIAGGQTITIPLDAQTTYGTRTPATASAVTNGSTVIVQLQGGRGAFGGGNGNGGQGGGPNASGAPGRTLGPASAVTVVPSGS